MRLNMTLWRRHSEGQSNFERLITKSQEEQISTWILRVIISICDLFAVQAGHFAACSWLKGGVRESIEQVEKCNFSPKFTTSTVCIA